MVPLGYRVENRALHIFEDHAILIRRLFTSYIELGSVSALKCRLDAAALHVPERIDGAGRRCGGKPFSRGQDLVEVAPEIGRAHV